MKYEIFLAPRARKQYEKLDPHIRKEIKTLLSELEDEPYNKSKPLKGLNTELHYIKLSHVGVQYRVVYVIDKKEKEVLVTFLGSRENFYKELMRFIRQ
jgi:mRNA-degrading endonuclease RelE of RelBE toxin-antitoxin system